MALEKLWKEPLPLAEVGPIIADLIDAVAKLHDLGLVDRALSPERVYFPDGRARLTEPKPLPSSREPDLAPFDATLGSFACMAPEQVRGTGSVDGRADIYALGALAFRALTGKLPFEGPNALTLIALKLDRPPRTLEEAAGRPFSPLAESFVATAMERDPARRYATIGVAREAWRLVCAAR